MENLICPTILTWTIYTKSNCIYCTKVKELLESNNINFTIVNCDEYLINNEIKEIFLSQMENFIGKGYLYKTFPMVFDGINFIGGFTDTEKYIRTNWKQQTDSSLVFEDDF